MIRHLANVISHRVLPGLLFVVLPFRILTVNPAASGEGYRLCGLLAETASYKRLLDALLMMGTILCFGSDMHVRLVQCLNCTRQIQQAWNAGPHGSWAIPLFWWWCRLLTAPEK